MHKRASLYPLCRHLKTNGIVCQSPALRESAFCHHHQKLSRAVRTPKPHPSTRIVHPLNNAESIQQALAMVFSGLASRRIQPKTAGRMFYALQFASKNLDNR
jgi:hypothetical protein